jgi:hypothetical protein
MFCDLKNYKSNFALIWFFRIFFVYSPQIIYFMKHREIIMRRLERVEGGIEKLQLALRQGNWTMVDEMIQEMRDNINDAKSFVQQEPLSPGEVNTQF